MQGHRLRRQVYLVDKLSLLGWAPASMLLDEWIPQIRRLKLLTTNSDDVATRIASQLNQANQMRQELEKQIRDHALEIIKNETDDDTKGIVVASKEWDERAQGVVGIVASRLVEQFHKPVFCHCN